MCKDSKLIVEKSTGWRPGHCHGSTCIMTPEVMLAQDQSDQQNRPFRNMSDVEI